MAFRILLADDHDILCEGLRSILSSRSEWEICGIAVNGREAVELARDARPDLVIMDIGMPALNGLGATRQIVKELPKTQVLILTMHHSEQMVREILDAGSHGYVLKSDASRDLVAAVESLSRHKLWFTSKVSEMMLRGYLKSPPSAINAGPDLTAREQEIVQLLAEGHTNKEVAACLHISVKTAETHRGHLMAKLKLHNLGELVRYAVRNGIIEP